MHEDLRCMLWHACRCREDDNFNECYADNQTLKSKCDMEVYVQLMSLTTGKLVANSGIEVQVGNFLVCALNQPLRHTRLHPLSPLDRYLWWMGSLVTQLVRRRDWRILLRSCSSRMR